MLQILSFENISATVILIVSIVVVFMLLRYAVMDKTLEDTLRILRIHDEILTRLIQRVEPRTILEMDLPLSEISAVVGGDNEN